MFLKVMSKKSYTKLKKVSKETLNLTEENLENLKKLFPPVFSEGKIDFGKLKILLGDEIDERVEKYNFSWAGKSDSFKNIQTTTKGTLISDKEDSVDFDKTKNVFIEGDNLEVLKLLQKSYQNKIKMIYIDPPYNTGKDFVYKDNFKDSIKNYEKITGQVDEEGNRTDTNKETNGRFHSDWLTMMYPRLYLAKNLLKEDGVIFVSIDDHEVHNLRKIMDDIFGEENFVGEFAWRKKAGAGADSKMFFRQHEYILLYSKNSDILNELYQPLTEKQKKEYSNPDNDLRGNWAPTDLGSPAHDNDPKRIYIVTSPRSKKFKKCWSYTKENFENLIKEDLIWWGKDGNSMPKRKRFLSDKKGLTPWSWINFCLTSEGKKNIIDLDLKIFDYPKPVSLIKHFIQIGSSQEDIILDFFAGSGTTAHAVLDLNKDGGNKKFICVQLPEKTDEKSEAYKTGYKTISEISKERIRRVIERIKKEDKEKAKEMDLGFKVFKLAKSNYKIWEGYEGGDKEELLEQMELFQSPLVAGYKRIDLIYEVLIKELGYSLNSEIKEIKEIKSNKIFKISDGDKFFYICLDDKIKEMTIKDLKLNKEIMFVCLDESLDDSQKINLSLKINLRSI